MPPKVTFTNISINTIMPPMGLKLSCMALTEPFDVCVVQLPHKAERSVPKRSSLPSRLAPGWESLTRAAFGIRSEETTTEVEISENVSITAPIPIINRRRPLISAMAISNAKGMIVSEAVSITLANGVGFSSGTLEFGPYQPPPLVPSCLIATIDATGPKGIDCTSSTCASSIST